MLATEQLTPDVTVERLETQIGDAPQSRALRFRFVRVWRPNHPLRPVMLLCFGFLLAWAALRPASFDLPARALFGALGALLTYAGLADLVNRTVITVGPRRLRVHHSPVPWPGTTDIRLEEIRGARVGSYADEYETFFAVYVLAGEKELRVVPGRTGQQDAYRIANALNTAIYEVRESRAAA